MTRKERIVLLTLSLLIHHGITQSQVHLPHAIRHQCYVHTSSELKNHKEFKKSGKQEQNFSFEDFTLTNESAIKVNFVLVTDDPNLEEFREYDYPIPTLEDYINHLNQSFSELVSIEKWYGFEMARVTKLYSE